MEKELIFKAEEYYAGLPGLIVRCDEEELNQIIQFVDSIPGLEKVLESNKHIKNYVNYAKEDFEFFKKSQMKRGKKYFKSSVNYASAVLNHIINSAKSLR